jgi:hypothetical protein
MLVTDKRWAQLIVPPALTLVWLLVSSQILKLARPGGKLGQNRSLLNWYSSIVVLLVMYVVWFQEELRVYWRVWAVIFVFVAVLIMTAGILLQRQAQAGSDQTILLESKKPTSMDWKRVLLLWVVANLAGLVVVSIFWFFGN